MFVRMLLCDMMDPFGCDGTCAATAEAPQWRHRQRGGIRSPSGCVSIGTRDALFAAEVQSFLQGKCAPAGSFRWHGGEANLVSLCGRGAFVFLSPVSCNPGGSQATLHSTYL